MAWGNGWDEHLLDQWANNRRRAQEFGDLADEHFAQGELAEADEVGWSADRAQLLADQTFDVLAEGADHGTTSPRFDAGWAA